MKNLTGALLALLIAVSGGAQSKGETDDYTVAQTGASGKYLPFPGMEQRRWPGNTIEWWYNPAGELLPTEATVRAISEAAAAWERVSGVRFVYRGTTHQALTLRADDKLVIGWLEEGSFQSRFGPYAAYTMIWWNGTQLIDGEITLNRGMGKVQIADFQGLLTHELGHVIGLDHSDVPASIMFARPYHPGRYQQFPREDDIRAVRSLYPAALDCRSTHGAVVTGELEVHLPAVRYGDDYYWADLTHLGDNQFSVTAQGRYDAPFLGESGCEADALLSADLKLTAPLVYHAGQALWARLESSGSRGDRLLFRVSEVGAL